MLIVVDKPSETPTTEVHKMSLLFINTRSIRNSRNSMKMCRSGSTYVVVLNDFEIRLIRHLPYYFANS